MKKIFFTPVNKEIELVTSYPVPATKAMPEWYKKIAPYFNGNKIKVRGGVPNTTVKHCSPFLDAMTAGYTFTLANDLIIDWENGVPNFNWRTTRVLISTHSLEQSAGVPVPDGYYQQVYKFENDIKITLPKGYSLFCTQPVNRFDLPFQIISGFVDADNYGGIIKFPFFIKKDWEGILEAGTPLAQLIPVKRDAWQSEVLPANEEETTKFNHNYFSRIKRSYKTNHWIKKTYQ
jgi:hypothetical protein